MQPISAISIPVVPSTHVRMTRNEYWLIGADDDYLHRLDEKKRIQNGKPGGLLRRKRQLVKYMEYKQAVRDWATETGFKMPHGYFALAFCMPMPARWSKKKVREHLLEPHQNQPDSDNLVKALFDSLMPRRNRSGGQKGDDDRKIHCYSAFKLWVLPGDACIRVIEYRKGDFLTEYFTLFTEFEAKI